MAHLILHKQWSSGHLKVKILKMLGRDLSLVVDTMQIAIVYI